MLDKKLLFFLLLFFISVVPAQPKNAEYSLSWAILPEFTSVGSLKTSVENHRFQLKSDNKTPEKELRAIKIILECKIYYEILSVKDNMMIVSVLRREGKITCSKGSKQYVYKLDDPLKVKEIKDPDVQNFIPQVTGGFAFRINLKTSTVEQTWQLEEIKLTSHPDAKKDIMRYKRTSIGVDPYLMTEAVQTLPNKKVPVGYEWNRTRFGNQVEKLKFEKVMDYNKRKVAKITKTGTILKNGQKTGSTQGDMIFDLEYGSFLEQTDNVTYEEVQAFTGTDGKPFSALEKVKIKTESRLLQTNFGQIKK